MMLLSLSFHSVLFRAVVQRRDERSNSNRDASPVDSADHQSIRYDSYEDRGSL
jgi:hypothetical protein